MLSYELVDKGGFGSVVSIDNDDEVIRHMAHMHRDDRRLKWYTYDILNNSSDCSCISKDICGCKHMEDERYDLIIDKGTLDAILVGGAICDMLYQVYRLLKPRTGVYFICSLFSREVIYPILSSQSLGYTVQYHTICSGDGMSQCVNDPSYNVYICRKICKLSCKDTGHFMVNISKLAEEERIIMNEHYQMRSPLLTADEEGRIKQQFKEFVSIDSIRRDDLKAGSDVINRSIDNVSKNVSIVGSVSVDMIDFIPLPQVYAILFGDDHSLGYSYELFLEDVHNFTLTKENYMNSDEAIEFMRTMQ